MKQDRVRPVLVAEGDRLVGVISQADLARHAAPYEPIALEMALERVSEPAAAGAA